MLLWVVGLGVFFALTVYLFDMTCRQMLALGVVAIVVLVLGGIRTWKNPEIHR
jgi:hypothetical protein